MTEKTFLTDYIMHLARADSRIKNSMTMYKRVASELCVELKPLLKRLVALGQHVDQYKLAISILDKPKSDGLDDLRRLEECLTVLGTTSSHFGEEFLIQAIRTKNSLADDVSYYGYIVEHDIKMK